MSTFFDQALKVFVLDEGYKFAPYKDSNNFWTVGVGHLIGESLERMQFTSNIINELFREDLSTAIKDSRAVIGEEFFEALSSARKLAVVSMLFTLGRQKFSKFIETIDAIKRSDWDEVANRILNTKWAIDVDPKKRSGLGRDDRIAYMFRTGNFHPDYHIGDDNA